MKGAFSLLFACCAMVATATASVAADQPPAYDRYERPIPPPPASSEPGQGLYAPPPRHAEHGQGYMNIHFGTYDPNNSSDGLAGYDEGHNFDMGFGSRVTRNFAFEGTFGSYGADRGSNEVWVFPVTIGARFIFPSPVFEPYFGMGGGLYFAHLKEAAVGSYSGVDDSDTTLGAYLSGGFDAWLNRRVALNFEAKYHMATPTFATNLGNSVDVNVSGWTINLGLRIAFGRGAN